MTKIIWITLILPFSEWKNHDRNGYVAGRAERFLLNDYWLNLQLKCIKWTHRRVCQNCKDKGQAHHMFSRFLNLRNFLCFVFYIQGQGREEVVESGNLTYGIRTYSFWPFDFNQGYFNQFEVLESQKWPLVDKIKSFYIKSALSFSDFQLLYGQKTVYSLQPLLFLEIIALNLRLCISFSVLM